MPDEKKEVLTSSEAADIVIKCINVIRVYNEFAEKIFVFANYVDFPKLNEIIDELYLDMARVAPEELLAAEEELSKRND